MKRLKYIDNARGLLILLVLLGHVFPDNAIVRIIYSFHVPSFFLISGYLFNKSSALSKPIKNNAIALFQRFIIPYLFFETIGGIVNVLFHGYTIQRAIYDMLTIHCNLEANWYLVSVFFAELIFIIMQKNIKDNRIITLIIILMSLTIFIMPRIHVCFVIERTLVALFFINLGYSARFIFENEKNQPLYWLIALGITLLIAYVNPDTSVFTWRFGNPILFVASSVSGVYAILSVCRYNFFDFFSYIGSVSLQLMGTHQLFIPFLHFHLAINYISLLLIDIPFSFFLSRFFPKLTGKKRLF